MTGLFIGIALFFIAADQLTKLLLYGKELPLIPGVVCISSPGLNKGMAWGLLNDTAWGLVLLIAVTVVTVGILLAVYFKYRRQTPAAIAVALAMIVGGAIGNLIDRIALGGVRDFICTEFMDFPVFNVADIGVTCGGILLGVMLIFTKAGHKFAAEVFKEDKKPGGKRKAS